MRKWYLNPKGENKEWNPEGELGRPATMGGAVTFGLGLQLVRDGPAGIAAGEQRPSLAFPLPYGLLLGLPIGQAKQKSESKRSHQCSQSIEISFLGQRAGVNEEG